MHPLRNLVFLVLSTATIGMASCSRGASGDEPFSWEDDFADPSSGLPDGTRQLQTDNWKLQTDTPP